MKSRTIAVAFAAGMLLLAGLAAAKPPSGKRIIDQVQDAFKDMETLRCDFRQESSLALLSDDPVVTTGTMELVEDDKFRFETAAMIMVSDGKTLWRYNKQGTPQTVIVENLKEVEEGLVPSEFLFRYPKKFNVEKVDEGTLSGRPVWILDMLPKKGDTGIQRIHVWVDQNDGLTRKMELTDDSGTRNLFTIDNLQLNILIPDSRFELEIPDGVKVYDLR